MPSPLDNTDIRTWDRDEIAQLIEYAKYLQQENEDMRANVIAMQAKLNNEEAKVKNLKNLLNQIMYGERN